MSADAVFYPERRAGRIFHGAAVLALASVAGFGFFQVATIRIGPAFLLFLLLTVAVLAVMPVLVYRLYALENASYTVARDGLSLHWGLRRVQIPMDEILWVRRSSEIETSLQFPRLRLPGAVLGTRGQPALGKVEFLSARSQDLILIATPERVFAVSPARSDAFLHAFQHFIEMGSLAPLPSHSVYPTILLSLVWEERYGRWLLLGGLFMGIFLALLVTLLIPTRQQVYLGFRPDGSPGDLVPAARLLLLPLINTFFLLANTLAGFFLFRRLESRSLAYLFWGLNLLTPLLFLVGIISLFSAGGR